MHQDNRSTIRNFLQHIHDEPFFAHSRGPIERSHMDQVLKDYIYKFCYYTVADDGKLLNQLFPNNATIDVNKDTIFTPTVDLDKKNYSRRFYKLDYRSNTNDTSGHSNTNRAKNHSGRNCGRSFSIGEPIYRCQECGFDNTCVLCVDCFNPNDHVNHHIYTDICSELNSGICDCGDKEAWNSNLTCLAASAAEPDHGDDDDDGFDPNLLETLLSEILDHILTILSQHVKALPTLNTELTLKLRELKHRSSNNDTTSILQIINDLSFHPLHDETFLDQDLLVLVYNDEYHNYSQAITAFRQGIPDNKHLDLLTSWINEEGRSVLKCFKPDQNDTSLDNLIEGFFAVQTNGLCATLSTWKEYINQEVCKYLIYWLNHCLRVPNSNFQTVYRETLGKVFCSEANLHTDAENTISKRIARWFPNKFNKSFHDFIDLSLLTNENTIPRGYEKHLKLSPDNIDKIPVDKLNETEYSDITFAQNTRLQYFLYFDNRLWKKLRKKTQNLIVPILSSSITYKPIFCQQFVSMFNHLTRSLTYMDREPQLTIMKECVVQLFTCPTNVKWIVEIDKRAFQLILWSIIDIFHDFTKIESNQLVWQKIQRTNPSKSFSISFKQGLHTIETLLGIVNNPNTLLNAPNFITLMNLCKLFHNSWKLKRKEGDHVLTEDQSFIAYVEYTSSIFNMINIIGSRILNYPNAQGLTVDTDANLLINSLRLLQTYLTDIPLDTQDGTSGEYFKCHVANSRVSYMKPLNTLYSILTEKLSSLGKVSLMLDENSFYNSLKISEMSLRSIVLCSQVEIGFWVRNGMSVLLQLSYYKKTKEFDAYARDIHLNQLPYISKLNGPNENELDNLLFNTLSRWELLDWFQKNDATPYQDKFYQLVEQFIIFNYHVLTERSFYLQKPRSDPERLQQDVERAIIYSLFTKPLRYSQILGAMPTYIAENTTEFDTALNKVADFENPRGLVDNGMFKLKPEMYLKIDPLSFANLNNDFENSADIIKSHLEKNTKRKRSHEQHIIEPQLTYSNQIAKECSNIGSSMKTKTFAALLSKLLQTSLDNEEITYVYHLLHLIHAIFKDEQMIKGEKNTIPSAYLNVPICNQLMAIAETKKTLFSDLTVRKANYLLDKLIAYDSNKVFELMKDSFGQEFTETFQAKRCAKAESTSFGANAEVERKKKLAKKRQKRILAKFNNQQSRFLEENHDLIESDTHDGATLQQANTMERFYCALCQENNNNGPFIIPAYRNNSAAFRTSDIFDMKELTACWEGFNNDDYGDKSNNDLLHDELRSNSTVDSKKVFVSCNHMAHQSCFNKYLQKKRFPLNAFICPVCQTFSNCIIPISNFAPLTDINLDNILDSREALNKFIKSVGTPLGVSYKKYKPIFEAYGLSDYGTTQMEAACSENLDEYISHWTNTTSILEICSRIDKWPHISYLKGQEQKYRMLAHIFSSVALAITCEREFMGHNLQTSNKPTNEFMPNKLFQHIFREILLGKQPFRKIVSMALFTFVQQLLSEALTPIVDKKAQEIFATASKSKDFLDIPDDILQLLKSFISTNPLNLEVVSKEVYTLTYNSLLRNLLPTLKRCLILVQIFNNLLQQSETDMFWISGLVPEEYLDTDDLPLYVDRIINLVTDHASLADILAANETLYHDEHLNKVPYERTSVIKLASISEHLNSYITNPKQHGIVSGTINGQEANYNRLDFKICLTCGSKVQQRSDRREMSRHLYRFCFSKFGVFLVPNKGEINLFLAEPPSAISIPAPYINCYGETGRHAMRRGDLTLLNLDRYRHINELWLNNEIPGYISRVMGDEFRINILSNGFMFALNTPLLRTTRRTRTTRRGEQLQTETAATNTTTEEETGENHTALDTSGNEHDDDDDDEEEDSIEDILLYDEERERFGSDDDDEDMVPEDFFRFNVQGNGTILRDFFPLLQNFPGMATDEDPDADDTQVNVPLLDMPRPRFLRPDDPDGSDWSTD